MVFIVRLLHQSEIVIESDPIYTVSTCCQTLLEKNPDFKTVASFDIKKISFQMT